jgi:hypothetical protein
MDISFVMVLIGGSMTLRVKGVTPITWMAFGLLSTLVGGFLMAETWQANLAYAASMQAVAANVAMLGGC